LANGVYDDVVVVEIGSGVVVGAGAVVIGAGPLAAGFATTTVELNR
jgi:hypothetical protein